MKPYAKYLFKLPYSTGKKFVIHEHTGDLIPEFTPEIITPVWSDIKLRFESLPAITILGIYPPLRLYYISEMPDFSFGTFKNYAILAKFERDKTKVTEIKMWFFNKDERAIQLYDWWISCQLELE